MKRWMKIALWSLFGIAVLTLLSMVRATQDETVLARPTVLIHAKDENIILTGDQLLTEIIRKRFYIPGETTWKELSPVKLESSIRQMPEVRNVHVYTNLGSTWSIDVELRRPVARIFNIYGDDFYLDADGKIMLQSRNPARVLVVTGAMRDKSDSPPVSEIINNDSLKSIRKLDDVYRISNYVCNDPLMQAQIAQVHLLKNGEFVLIPMVGGQKIIFGSADTEEEVEEKFQKLKIFYKEAIPYEGWSKYDEINLSFKGQIVCRKKE